MNVAAADRVWNRAALDAGGESPRDGDRALVALLRIHGLVMNGGVHHAVESVGRADLVAAAHGYEFFGLAEAAAFFRGVAFNPVLQRWTGETEDEASRRYAALVSSDGDLILRFRRVYDEQPQLFAPIDHA